MRDIGIAFPSLMRCLGQMNEQYIMSEIETNAYLIMIRCFQFCQMTRTQ